MLFVTLGLGVWTWNWAKNQVQYHSGVGLQHLADVHEGIAPAIRTERQCVLDHAYAAHLDRFIRSPTAPQLRQHVWIDKPTIANEP